MIPFQNPFRRPSLSQVNEQSLEQARYCIAEHKSAAEFHAAMIGMYEQRIARLAEESGVVA